METNNKVITQLLEYADNNKNILENALNKAVVEARGYPIEISSIKTYIDELKASK
jgi:hypothetical protein